MTVTTLDLPVLQALGLDVASHPFWEPFAEVCAVWGIAAVPIVLVALWLSGDPEARLAGIRSGLSAMLGLLLAGMLSWVFYEPRPFAEGISPNVLHHVADSSFPSDHVTVLAAVALVMFAAGRTRTAFGIALVTVVVAWARVALGVHYPSDIVGGAVLGIMAALLFRCEAFDRFSRFSTRIADGLVGRLRCDDLLARTRHMGDGPS